MHVVLLAFYRRGFYAVAIFQILYIFFAWAALECLGCDNLKAYVSKSQANESHF